MLQYKQSLIPLKRQITELEYIVARSDIKLWAAVQEIVRAGLASKAFNIGDQLLANYNGSPVAWDVIGIGHDVPLNKQYENSLTLQAHDCILNCQFSAPQALYYAEEELPFGEQIFTLNSVKYKFITGQPVPEGGQVFISSWEGDTYVPTKITTYASDRTTAIESSIDVTAAESGADTLLEVNDLSRCRYGSNNYTESAIRQWLNSSASSFTWTPQTKYDRPSTLAPYTGAGFLNLLDPELVAVLGAVDKQVARNTVTNGDGQDLFSDKVFLLSCVEVFGGTEGTTTGEKVYPYYSAMAASATTSALAGRIKYSLNGTAQHQWLRSPYPGSAYSTRTVNTTGGISYSAAYNTFWVAPAYCIV